LVLVIDDDARVRELVSRFLTGEGHRVLTAASAAEGLQLARDASPAAVALDVALPDGDGWAGLAALKADRALAGVPGRLFATADDAGRCYALGASDFLTRPVNWEGLSALLQKCHGPNPAGRILIVDDEVNNREVLRSLVTKEGWSVAEAGNGRAALKAVA